MKNKISLILFVLLIPSVFLTGCGNQKSGQSDTPDFSISSESISAIKPKHELLTPSQKNSANGESNKEENSEMNMIVNVNGQDFIATLEENDAVNALVQMMKDGPITLQLSDYAGFEKVGPLGQILPTNNSQTTTHSGDIVLYQGNKIVMFYGSNSWSYTRLGRINDIEGWQKALGSGDVTVILSMES